MPARKNILRRVCNRLFHALARVSPGATSLRPFLHRLRGVRIGRGAFIGDGVYIDNEYPEHVEIGERVQISIRATLIAHTRGPGRITIENEAFVGPHSILICGAGRVLRVGAGAVIGAGSVITRSVPAGLYVAAPAPQPVARVKMPLPVAPTMEAFWAGLVPLAPAPSKPAPPPPAPASALETDADNTTRGCPEL
jgi:serine acetyltransferase